ncbi:hypothetical protein BOSEA1005_11814 [Hyphomicrobiales bacterium]|nr:hypothetical protein BOSEA1005_11814 [Hyphomicrobiales bacterium]CAI0342408.1 hypothetical protein BO1005MUT1_180187 [Hyphomicrobiales bacterium]
MIGAPDAGFLSWQSEKGRQRIFRGAFLYGRASGERSVRCLALAESRYHRTRADRR